MLFGLSGNTLLTRQNLAINSIVLKDTIEQYVYHVHAQHTNWYSMNSEPNNLENDLE